MARAIHVLLPTCAHHLAATVLEAGGVPILDATVQAPAQVPDGAWVRIRPGQPAPGRGPVILAEDGAPVLDRPTWLEVASVHEVPPGFAGLVLKGSEAGGLCGEQSGVEMLAAHPQPDRVLVDAGLGPTATAAIGALGGAGVVICGPLLALPAFGLASALRRRLEVPDDEITHLVSGWRVGNPAVAPVLRQLAHGEDPWRLARQAWSSGDLREALWLIDQGAALATYIAETHHDVADAIATYDRAFSSWGWRATKARPAPVGRDVGSGAALQAHNAVAAPGGTVGLGVLWEQAARLGRPIRGPLRAAVATGLPLVAEPEAIEAARSALTKLAAAKGLPTSEPQTPAAPSDPAPPPAPSPSPPPSDDAPPGPPVPSDEPVAIIGLGCRLPGAHDVGAFWSNVQAGISAIIEVPSDRWAVERYYDPDPAAPDKTYSRIGGFLQGFTFDNRRFRVPPKVVPSLDPVQQITLHAVDDALRDAGLQADPRKPEGRPFSRERCAVILGNSLGGEIKDDYALRVAWPEIEAQLGQSPDIQALSPDRQRSLLQELRRAFKASLPPITEDSMPGELSNVIAGRVANAFDLRGANFTTDAACASSLAALQAAVQGLQRHDFDLAISGGADRSMNPSTYVKFCKIGALSPDRSTPFDKDANGFVMGEGVGVFVLKRLRDAVSDGDKVYAVIRGIGASSDGRGKGITAPNPRGQELALQRAYDQAGLDPAQVDLIEAHGTSTAVGDGVELNTLSAFIGQGKRGDRGPVRVGSVKSMIGHLKSAAGAAALIKAALAVYHGVLPPSLGFKEARPDVDLAAVPLQVQTRTEPWPATPDGVRRAGISAFGFGGTNFHVVIESWAGQPVPRRGARPRPALPRPRPMASSSLSSNEIVMAERPLPDGLWATSALDKAGLIQNLHRLRQGQPVPWHPSDPVRVAAAARDPQERASQIDRALKVLERDQSPDLLRARNVYVEDAPNDGKVAFLFTGQGSQYLDMGLDLAAAFPLVQRTFDEADQIVRGALGQGITDFIRSNPAQDRAEQERILQRTEISQPATLTVDVAILRLLASYGVYPDMVAGHSLGEYAACVAAGVMSFEQALHAVSARGREMASIRIDDPGKMAGVAASTDVVEELLAEIDGYVIAANKNCPTQTVIAGASDAVDEAVERFQARGLTVYRLPVSHAFHSRIVAPATEPLKVVLERLGLQAPRRPITTNVTSDYYPTGPDAATKAIELLGEQISAPVEWTSQIDRMYADGARLFVECGPKRALTGFVVSILKRRPHRAFYTNHPKRGGAQSFRDALAGLTAAGLPVRAEPSAQLPDLFATPAPRTATTEAVTARLALVEQITEATPDVTAGILRIVAAKTGYETVDLDLDFELEADLGIDTVKQAEIFAVVRETYGIAPDPSFSFADHRSLRSVIDWAAARIGATRPQVPQREPAPPADDDAIQSFLLEAAKAGMHGLDAEAFARALLPSVQGLIQAAFDAAHPSASPQSPPEPTTASPPTRKAPAPAPTRATSRPSISAPSPAWPQVVCTGASVGLPGGEEVFGPDNLARLLRGENRIGALGDRADRFLDMNIVRLRKDPTTGSGTFALVTDRSDVIKLAGQAGRFDLTEWGLPADRIEAFDITTRLAMAATFEALRDAGIPLQRTTKTTASGKVVPTGWALPEPLRDETGVIFASAFPGYDQLVQHLERRAEEPGAPFDRRFLFQVLAMGHSQIAQAIGARGPNTQINAACASPAQATAIAQDWLRVGRCRRVVVVSADNVTSEALLPWIGGGFLAAGAASIADRPEEAALPFDARRHGLVLGMGAHGMVLETAEAAAERGITPIAELLESVFVNSAFHGTRLHPSHIREVVQGAVHQTCQRLGISPQAFAREGLFMSHETYTPARGGSAQAEIEALRSAFGEAAGEITIANTKGYTGHPMSAGIEDTVTVKALQYGQLPPIANFRDPDPALGDLRLAKGERRRVRYALRLAAGFGSQLACTLWRGIAVDDDRDDLERRRAWLHRVTGYDRVREEIGQRTLRVVPSDTDLLLPLRPQVSPAGGQAELRPVSVPQSSVAPAPAAPPARPSSATSPTAILQELTQLVAEKTGYDPSEIEPDFELEADLGIDTVKQAEIFSEIRDRHGLQRDDSFSLADHPTVEALASWLAGALGASAEPSGTAAPQAAPSPIAPATPPAHPSSTTSPTAILQELTQLVAEKTGYDPSEIEPDFELEADLGIDTVKQAEIFSEIRDRHGLQRDDSFSLADHPTVEALASWLAGALQASTETSGSAGPASPAQATPKAEELVIEDELLVENDIEVEVETITKAASVERNPDLIPTPIAAPARLPVSPKGETAVPSGYTPPSSPPERPLRLEPPQDLSRRAPYTAPLPEAFRIRRPTLILAPASPSGALAREVVHVIGPEELVNAVNRQVLLRGARLGEDATVVVDLSERAHDSFGIAKAYDERPPKRWLAVTFLGGLQIKDVPVQEASRHGARAGFAKALGREWSDTLAQVLDVPPGLEPEATARLIADELDTPSRTIEIFRSTRVRRTVGYSSFAIPQTGSLRAGSVVLLTGGGRGITARVALELARRAPVVLIVVGRGPAAHEPIDLNAEKESIREALRATGSRVTPAEIERRLAPLRRTEELRSNLEAMRQAGALVEYQRLDLADAQGIRALVQAVLARHGRLDICVHGAGVEESKLLRDKDAASFSRVFDGKALGGLALLEALPATTVFVSMGSVAGRFGNAGQVDYSAANDSLARVVAARGGALHIDWTAWDDVGMAVRGGMKRLLTDRGVDLLPADAGAGLLVDLLAAGATGELIVSGRLGDFLPEPEHPLLRTIDLDGEDASARATLTLPEHPWLDHHAIGGTPVLPGVIGVELMAAVAAFTQPGQVYAGARKVVFRQAAKLHRGAPLALKIHASPSQKGRVRCTLSSTRTLRTGREQSVKHFEGEIQLGFTAEVEGLPSAFFPDETYDQEAIYQRFFHGPVFQVLRAVQGVARDGLVAEARIDPELLPTGLSTEPLLLEAAFQAAGFHQMIVHNELALPSTIDEVQLLGTSRPGQRVSLMVRRRGNLYDVDATGSYGPLLRLRGFRMAVLGPLDPDKAFAPPDWERPAVFESSPNRGPALGPLSRAHRGEPPERWLSRQELTELSARGLPRRIADRLIGRIAAKRALSDLTGVDPAQIRVASAPSGEPLAQVPGWPEVRVSISHRDGEAVAIAAQGGRIGIDLERIEPRSTSFLQDWFHERELTVLGSDPIHATLGWSIKEAVLKALGQGLAISPREVQVIDVSPGHARVALSGRAAALHRELGGGEIRITWSKDRAERLIVQALFAA